MARKASSKGSKGSAGRGKAARGGAKLAGKSGSVARGAARKSGRSKVAAKSGARKSGASGKRRASSRGARLSWRPEGYHTITPSLIVKDAEAAIRLYKDAFGAEEVMCLRSPDGGIMHAELRIGDSVFMMGGEWPDHGMKAPLPNHVSGGLHIYVENVDKAFERALSAGCSVAMPVMNMFWGDRYGKVLDPFGHIWGLATRVEEVSPEECARRAASWQP